MAERAEDIVTWTTAKPGITSVVLNRPPANALGIPLLDGMHLAIDAAEKAGDVKVMVISSAQPKFFAAGADIKHLSSIDAETFTAYGDKMREVNDRLAAAGVDLDRRGGRRSPRWRPRTRDGLHTPGRR